MNDSEREQKYSKLIAYFTELVIHKTETRQSCWQHCLNSQHQGVLVISIWWSIILLEHAWFIDRYYSLSVHPKRTSLSIENSKIFLVWADYSSISYRPEFDSCTLSRDSWILRLLVLGTRWGLNSRDSRFTCSVFRNFKFGGYFNI